MFITGGNGFVGASLVRRLVLEGHHVRIMLRRNSSTERLREVLDKVEIVYADFEHLESVERSLNARHADAVIHAAWSGVTAADRDGLAQVTGNLAFTIKICELAARTGCQTFVGIGSQAEYGVADEPLTEDTVLKPVTAYGFAKYTAWSICQKICELAHMRFLWFRLLSAYGPGDDRRHMLPYVIRCLLQRERPKLTRGLQKWDYLYIDDCGLAVDAALKSKAAGTFVLGSGKSSTIRSVVEMVRDKIDAGLPLGFGEVSDSPTVLNLSADISCLTAATGWRPSVSLADGLDRTIAFIQEEELHALIAHKAVLNDA